MTNIATNRWKKLQIITIFFFLIIQIIEIVRPITKIPNVTLILNPNQTIFAQGANVWSIFGNIGGRFAFYTTLTNIITIVTIFLAWVLKVKINRYWQIAIMTYLIVLTLVFFSLLAPQMPWGQSPWFDYVSIHEHLLITLLGIWWFLTSAPARVKNTKISAFITLIFPTIYLIFVIFLYVGTNGNVAVYPFLNFKNIFNLNLNIYLSISLSIATIGLLTMIFIGLNFLFVRINQNKTGKCD